MPNCFKLVSKHTHKRVALQEVDKELCEHFHREFDEMNWMWLGDEGMAGTICNWYDFILGAYAMGKTWQEQREMHRDPEDKLDEDILQVIDYLEQNYEVYVFYIPLVSP